VALPDNRNRLSSDAVARLLLAIRSGEAVSRRGARRMMALLERSIAEADDARDPANQVLGFLGEGLPEGARLWSKAGWTSSVRHDAAIVRLPGGREFILVVFLADRRLAGNRLLLPYIARQVVKRLTA
jgi:beta-lactamase family protein